MRYRSVTVATLALGLILGSASAAEAGGDRPSTAPTLTVGQSYAGTTYVGGKSVTDIWKLPALMLSDAVTIAAANDSIPGSLSGYQYMCLAGNVDDFSWYANQCNLADKKSFTGAGTRMTLYATANAEAAFLQVRPGYEGAYHFTLEAIRHKVMANITVPSAIEPNLTIPLTAVYTNGAPVAGKLFTLTATWSSGGTWSTTATTDAAGNATFAVALPDTARGKTVSMTATAAETATDQAAATAAATAAVSAPPPPAPAPAPVVAPAPAPAPVVAPAPTQLQIRAWAYSRKGKLECDVDPNNAGEFTVQLQKLVRGTWVNSGPAKTTGIGAKATHRKWNPKKGYYRVQVSARPGYLAANSPTVRIKR